MQLSNEDIQHIATLARIGVEEKELPYYAQELSAVLNYVEQLHAVATDSVEPTSHVTGLHTVTREDDINDASQQGEAMRQRLTKLVPLAENGWIKVRSVFGKKIFDE